MKIGGAPIEEDRARIEAVLKEIGSERATRRRCQRPLRSGNRDRLRQNAARLSAVLVRGGRRSPRFPTCRPRSRNSIRVRWRPARICSATRTRATSFVTAECGPTATGCNSIARCRMDYANISAPSACCKPRAGRRAAASRMAATRCRSTSRPVSGSAAMRAILIYSSPMAVFPDGVRVENGHITMPDLPGIGFEGKSDLYKEMKALAA